MKNQGGTQNDKSRPINSSQKSARQSGQQANSYLDVEAGTMRDKEVSITAVWDKSTKRYDLEGAVKSQQLNPTLFSSVISRISPLEKEPYWNHHQLDTAICSFRLKRLLDCSFGSVSDLSDYRVDRLEQQILGLPDNYWTLACLADLSGSLHREETVDFQTKKGCAVRRERLQGHRES